MEVERKEKLTSQLKELKIEYLIRQQRNKQNLEEIKAIKLRLDRLKEEQQKQHI